MSHRHYMATAIRQAITTDLSPIFRFTEDGVVDHRPSADDVHAVAFSQTADGDTVIVTVVIGPERDAAVYFGEQLAYRVNDPNGRFFDDMAHRCLSKENIGRMYESYVQ